MVQNFNQIPILFLVNTQGLIFSTFNYSISLFMESILNFVREISKQVSLNNYYLKLESSCLLVNAHKNQHINY